MNPTNEQKLIILMLADIAEKLGADAHFDPKLVAKAISYDSAWMLPFKYDMVLTEEQTPPDVTFVINVLDMFDFLESSVEELPESEKVEIAAAPGGSSLKFCGFDGNNEGSYMSIATHLTKDLDLFDRFKDRYLNSHCPRVGAYSRMYTTFDRIRPNIVLREMTKEEVMSVIAEAVHPDYR